MIALRFGVFLSLTASLLTFPLRAAQQDTAAAAAPGYSVGVIAADSIARTALATTFSELITARLAGVEVLSSSGTIGAASRILIRGDRKSTRLNSSHANISY